MLVLAGRPLGASELIRLGQAVGLTANNIKSHLTRMVAEGALHREGPRRKSRYTPSAERMEVVRGIRVRLSTKGNERWDGSWIMLVLRLPKERTQRDRLRAALWFDGFRPVATETFVRPAWPHGWVEGCLAKYLGVCGGAYAKGGFVAEPGQIESLYDLDGLDRQARELSRWIEKRTASGLRPERAFAQRLEVGGKVAQFVGHDPRLPRAVWGKRDGIVRLVESYQRFEKRIAPAAAVFVDRTGVEG